MNKQSKRKEEKIHSERNCKSEKGSARIFQNRSSVEHGKNNPREKVVGIQGKFMRLDIEGISFKVFILLQTEKLRFVGFITES